MALPLPILIAVQIGLSATASFLTPKPKLQKVDRGKHNDLRFTLVEEGAFWPRVYGRRVRLGGNLVWGPPTEERVTSTTGSSGGKKGRGATPPTDNYTYHKSFRINVCEGPIRAFLKITDGDDVIFNQSPLAGGPGYYEAEDSGNTLAGGAAIVSDSAAYNARAVSLGSGSSVTFPTVIANTAGQYSLAIYFATAATAAATVRVNNTTDYAVTCEESFGLYTIVEVLVDLDEGPNEIKITKNSGTTLKVDRLFLFAGFTLDENDVTGIVNEGPYPGDPNDPSNFYNRPLFVNPHGQMIGTIANAGQAQLEFYLGTGDQPASPTMIAKEGAEHTPADRWLAGVVFKDYLLKSPQLENLTFEVQPLYEDLADILAHEHRIHGARDDEFDFEALRGTTVEGLYINELAPLGPVIEALTLLYDFKLAPIDDKIVAVPNGQPSVRTIPNHELLAYEAGAERPAGIRIEHSDPADLPAGVYIAYIDPNPDLKNFHNSTVFVPFGGEGPALEAETINLPLVIPEPAQAVAAGKRYLFARHLQDKTLNLSLTPRHADLTPTDVVTLELPQKTLDVTLLSTQIPLPGPIPARALPEEAGLYNQVTLDEIGDGAEPKKVPFPANSFLWLGDVPLLAHEDDRLRLLAAASPRGRGRWPTAYLFKELVHESDEFERLFPFPRAANLGHLVAALDPVTSALELDHVTELTIDLFFDDGSIASVPEADILARPVNQLILGNGFQCEILRFATAEPLSASFPYVARYKLTNLLRGLYGTEHAANSGHDAGITAVLMNDAVVTLPLDANELQRTRRYKAPTVGQALQDAFIEQQQFLGYSKKPYAVTGITAARNETGDVLVWWIRRVRVAGQIRNLTGIARHEEDIRFRLELLDDGEPVHDIWVNANDSQPVPWVPYILDPEESDTERRRSAIRLNPYFSFLEVTLLPDLTGSGNIKLYDTDYQRAWWILNFSGSAPPFGFGVQEWNPNTFTYDDVYDSPNYDPGPSGENPIRPRVMIANGQLHVFEAFVNDGSLPVYTSPKRPPEIGPLAVESVGLFGPTISDAVAGTGRPQALFPAALQEVLFGGLVPEGQLEVRITQYSALVGPGNPATAFV